MTDKTDHQAEMKAAVAMGVMNMAASVHSSILIILDQDEKQPALTMAQVRLDKMRTMLKGLLTVLEVAVEDAEKVIPKPPKETPLQ